MDCSLDEAEVYTQAARSDDSVERRIPPHVQWDERCMSESTYEGNATTDLMNNKLKAHFTARHVHVYMPRLLGASSARFAR